jgi:hypothetical protein
MKNNKIAQCKSFLQEFRMSDRYAQKNSTAALGEV